MIPQKRTNRIAKKLARERAIDRGLRGPSAGRYINKTWRGIGQTLRGPFTPDWQANPRKQKRLQVRAVRRARQEIRRRRNN